MNLRPLTSREVLGLFFPGHKWHTVADVDFKGPPIDLECACGAKGLRISAADADAKGWSLNILVFCLENASRKMPGVKPSRTTRQ